MDSRLSQRIAGLAEFIGKDYQNMYREPGGEIKHPFLTPGSDQYCDILWDWDSWLTDVALRQIVRRQGDPEAEIRKLAVCEKGCVRI